MKTKPTGICGSNEPLKVDNNEEPNEKYWFPTLENPGNKEEYTPIQQRIYDELVELKKMEDLNPLDDETSRVLFLENFD